MFKFIKDSWKEAREKVEAEDRAKAEAAKAPKAPATRDVGAEMKGVAEGFAEQLKQSGQVLDFTEASLATLDKLSAGAFASLARMSEADRKHHEANVVLNVSAYLGEVIRREIGGTWVDAPDGLAGIDFGPMIVPVGTVTFGLLSRGAVQMPDGVAKSFAGYFQSLIKSGRNVLNEAVTGKGGDIDALRRDISDDPELAKFIIAQAQTAIMTASQKWGVLLDFSADSLVAVEQLLGQMHDGLNEFKPSDETLKNLCLVWGCYVGEVMRRSFGGKWKLNEGVLELVIGGATVFPSGKVRKRIVDGPADAIPFYFKAVGQHISTARQQR